MYDILKKSYNLFLIVEILMEMKVIVRKHDNYFILKKINLFIEM